MRSFFVALVTISSLVGVAAAAAPLPSTPSSVALPPLPSLAPPALAAHPAALEGAGPAAPASLPAQAPHVAPAALVVSLLPQPPAQEDSILLLPDGFAFLALEPGAPAETRLDLAPAEVFSAAAPAPAAPLVAAPRADVAPAPAAVAPLAQAPAAASPSVDAAASHAYVAAPARVPAMEAAAAGAALGLLGVLGIALYHRIRPHATLENDTRKAIFETVCTSPGLGVHAIASSAGVSYSTATYHLERLVAAGMIVMTPDGNKLCYYKNGGAFTEAERRILPLVKNDEAAKLLEAILDTPGTYRAALAERLGVTATTINWHLRRLREAGLIDEVRQGRNAYLTVRMAEARESFLSLAHKVEGTDAPAADRLRRFAAFTATLHSGTTAA